MRSGRAPGPGTAGSGDPRRTGGQKTWPHNQREGRGGRTSQLDPSDKAVGRAQTLTPALSRKGRGSQKSLRPRALLLF